MASKTLLDSKRFVHRSPNRKLVTYVCPKNKSSSHGASNIPSTKQLHISPIISQVPTPSPSPIPLRLVNVDTPRADLTPTRRVIVVRNNKPQITQRSVDTRIPIQRDSVRVPPINNDSHKSIYFIRRPIVTSELRKSIN